MHEMLVILFIWIIVGHIILCLSGIPHPATQDPSFKSWAKSYYMSIAWPYYITKK